MIVFSRNKISILRVSTVNSRTSRKSQYHRLNCSIPQTQQFPGKAPNYENLSAIVVSCHQFSPLFLTRNRSPAKLNIFTRASPTDWSKREIIESRFDAAKQAYPLIWYIVRCPFEKLQSQPRFPSRDEHNRAALESALERPGQTTNYLVWRNKQNVAEAA